MDETQQVQQFLFDLPLEAPVPYNIFITLLKRRSWLC